MTETIAPGVPLCETCGGKGFIVSEYDTKELPDGLQWMTMCPDCDGHGVWGPEEEASDE